MLLDTKARARFNLSMTDTRTNKSKSKAAKPSTYVCGHCRDREAGLHPRCRGGACICTCNAAGMANCAECGFRVAVGSDRCVDTAACDQRVAHWADQHERYRRLEEQVAQQRAAEAAIAGVDRPVRGPRIERPTSGVCEHCGEPTKGGKFVPGHDASLKGILLRAVKAGDTDALAEMVARGWFKNQMAVTSEIEERASDAAWLAIRIENRIKNGDANG